MDPLLIGGLVVSVAGIAAAMILDGNSLGVLVSSSSFVLVVLGTIGASVMAFRVTDVTKLPKLVVVALKGEAPDLDATIATLGTLAETARREGMLALEAKLEDVDDLAIRTAAQLLVDGVDAEQLYEVVQIDIGATSERHQGGISLVKAMGGYAPTFGMMGTVIGLVNMLQNLSDPSQLGIGMALALLTTLYGVMLANIVFLPLAARLERLNSLELASRDIILDGIMSIQAGMSPRLLVERLETYLAPERRVGYAARNGKGAGSATDSQEAA